MINVNKNLFFFSGLVLAASSLLFIIAQKLAPLLDHAVYYCQSLITTYVAPIPYFLSIIPIVLLFLLIAISLIKFSALSFKVTVQRRRLHDKIIIRKSILILLSRLGLEQKTIIIHSETPFAYCLGIKSPKIYISTGIIAKLNRKELEAVLRHEQYHLENHDTFTMIIASVAYSLLPFFPLLGDFIKKYRIQREIQADTFAINKIGSQYPLISALRKLLAFPSLKRVEVAAIADHDTLEPRIYSLLDKRYTRRQFRIKHVAITIFSTFLLGAIIVNPIYAEEIHHVDHDVVMVCTDGACMNSCKSEKNLNTLPENSSKEQTMPKASHLYSPNKTNL